MDIIELEREREELLKEHGELEEKFYKLRLSMIRFKDRVVNWANNHKKINPDMTTEDIDALIEKWNEFTPGTDKPTLN